MNYEEKKLLDLYRQCDERAKRHIFDMLEFEAMESIKSKNILDFESKKRGADHTM